ncbi:OmpP1/FadL family transporter [Flexibacterium corallicola]|uniref:OmpP1/FadL family transporter n=1 Tax=Flexibacterium corallicola TaxID=3037259 RepID=UPI00286F8E84|nr:outer membrane protein transport protein [Pseudovibrio sp. M1P-2-3]
MQKFKRIALMSTALGILAAPTSVLASGWDTTRIGGYDLLFSPKKVVVEGQATYVDRNVDFKNVEGSSNGGVHLDSSGALVDQSYLTSVEGSSNGAIPNLDLYTLSAKVNLVDPVDCLAQLHTPMIIAENPGDNWGGRYALAETDARTLSGDLTCSYSFNINEKSKFRLIGGVGATDTTYYTRSMFFLPDNPLTTVDDSIHSGMVGDYKTEVDLESDGLSFGWRAGAAYERPDIALRAYVIYNSEIDVDLEGSFLLSNPIVGDFATANANASIVLPQSVEFGIQSGIAPNWLLGISAKWMDWSVMDAIGVTFSDQSLSSVPDATTRVLNYSDAWSVEATLAHRFNERLYVGATVKWDEGIGDIYSDTYQFGLGGAYDITEHVKLSLGGRAVYKTDGNGTYQTEESYAKADYDYDDSWNFIASSRLTFSF